MLLQQSPFRGEDEDEIYDAILADEPLYPIHMPRDSVSILQKLLTREPDQRLGSGATDAQEIMSQPFFRNINWDDVYHKRVPPPFLPVIKNATDTSNFDSEFTSVTPVLTPVQSGMSLFLSVFLSYRVNQIHSIVTGYARGVPGLLVYCRLRVNEALDLSYLAEDGAEFEWGSCAGLYQASCVEVDVEIPGIRLPQRRHRMTRNKETNGRHSLRQDGPDWKAKVHAGNARFMCISDLSSRRTKIQRVGWVDSVETTHRLMKGVLDGA